MGIFVFNSFVNLTADLLLSYLSKAIKNIANDWLNLLHETGSLGRKWVARLRVDLG